MNPSDIIGEQMKLAVDSLTEWFRGETKRSDFVPNLILKGRTKEDEFKIRKAVVFPHPTKEGWTRSYGMLMTVVYLDEPIIPPEEEEEDKT